MLRGVAAAQAGGADAARERAELPQHAVLEELRRIDRVRHAARSGPCRASSGSASIRSRPRRTASPASAPSSVWLWTSQRRCMLLAGLEVARARTADVAGRRAERLEGERGRGRRRGDQRDQQCEHGEWEKAHAPSILPGCLTIPPTRTARPSWTASTCRWPSAASRCSTGGSCAATRRTTSSTPGRAASSASTSTSTASPATSAVCTTRSRTTATASPRCCTAASR